MTVKQIKQKGGIIIATGHVRQRTSKSGERTYQIVIEMGRQDPLTGKRSREYHTFHGNRKQAEMRLREMLHQYDNNLYANDHNMTLEELMKIWITNYKSQNLKPSTLERYREQINWYIVPMLGKYPLHNLTIQLIQKWVSDIYEHPPTKKNSGKKLAPKTVRNIFLNLKSALDYAVKLKMIQSNPCDHVELPKVVQKEVEAFDEDEIATILSLSKGTDLYFPIYLLLNTGMRRGELLGLKWKNVHLEEGYIEIVETKLSVCGNEITDTPKSRNSKRRIPIGENLKNEFKKYHLRCCEIFLKQGKRVKPDDYVICRSDGTFYEPNSFTRAWSRFLEKNGIRHLKLHGLRHTSATLLLKGGIDVKTISTRLGHADPTLVLTTYGHTLDSMSRNAADQIDSMLHRSKDFAV